MGKKKPPPLYAEFLSYCLSNKAVDQSWGKIALEIGDEGIDPAQLSRWRNGEKALGSIDKIAEFLFQEFGEAEKAEKTKDFELSYKHLIRCVEENLRLESNSPSMARQFLIDTQRLTKDGRLVTTAVSPDTADSELGADAFSTIEDLIDEQVESLTDDGTTIAHIDELSCVQMPSDATDADVAFELLHQTYSRVIGDFDLRYGAEEVICCVEVEKTELIKAYTKDDSERLRHLDRGKKRMINVNGKDRTIGCDWFVRGPKNNVELLDGLAVAHPICRVKQVEGAVINVQIASRNSNLSLKIKRNGGGQLEGMSDKNRQILIDRLFGVYINKLNELTESEIELCRASIIL